MNICLVFGIVLGVGKVIVKSSRLLLCRFCLIYYINEYIIINWNKCFKGKKFCYESMKDRSIGVLFSVGG